MLSHKLYIDADFLDDLCKTIEVPFPLAVGMELVVGPSADWTHFHLSTVAWHTLRNEMVCWLQFVNLRESLDMDQVREWLLADGWEKV